MVLEARTTGWAGTAAQETDMNRQVNAVPNQRLLIASVAMALFGILGITAGMAWAPGSADIREGAPVSENAPAQAEVISQATSEVSLPRGKCRQCGIVESMREMWTAGEGTDAVEVVRPARGKVPDQLTRSYVVTVRMTDGARRQFVEATSANWRPGERVILIHGGADD